MEITKGDYQISTDKARLDVAAIHHFLSTQSYWAKGIPLETVRRFVAHCLCFGMYRGSEQVGFARVITDYTTMGYLADVFVLPGHRRQGLSKWLVQAILEHPELQGFRRWLLATADAHGLYRQHGFAPLAKPDLWMEIHNPDMYLKGQPDLKGQPENGCETTGNK